MEKPFLSAMEVADLLGTSHTNVLKKCQAGYLPSVKHGRRVLIPRAAWEAYVAAQNEKALQNMKKSQAQSEEGV